MGNLFLLTGDYISNSKGKDAIVNAANQYMTYGSGICGAIYSSAGDELYSYCKNKFKDNMVNNEVRITPGFHLGMDIIHVLAPRFHEEEHPIEELMKGYDNLLDEIIKHGYKNVLLCSLGTGIHGYNHEDVARKLIRLLNDFCNNNDVNLYLNNRYPLYKDIYLKEYLSINNLHLKNDLLQLDLQGIKDYLYNNNLIENDIKNKYNEFVKDKELNDLCISEKIMCLQYTLENFDVSKEQIKILIDSFGNEVEII